MVPPGAAHICRPLAARAAKLLGIDFADAVTGFKFKGRIGEAVKNGVVVASEYANAVEAVIDGFQDAAQEEEDAKRSIESLRLWRRFVTGLRIGVRLGLYEGVDGDDMSGKAETVRRELNEAEEKQDEAMEAGGFFPDTAEETRPPVDRSGVTAQPRSLLSRAQDEAEQENASEEDIQEQAPRPRRRRNVAEEESDGDEREDEDMAMDGESQAIEEKVPRLRRRRKMLQEESKVDEDSEDEFLPEPSRPTSASRRQSRAKAQYARSPPPPVRQESPARNPKHKPEGSTVRRSPAAPAHRSKRKAKGEGQDGALAVAPAPRRSTRVTRSQTKLLEETTVDDEIDDADVEMAQDNVQTPGGGFLPDDGHDHGHDEAEEYGGGFFPEASSEQSTNSGPKPLFDQHDAADFGGGFIPNEEAMDAHVIEEPSNGQGRYGEVQPGPVTKKADDIGSHGGGFIHDDADMKGSFGSHPTEHEQDVFTNQPDQQDDVSVVGRGQWPAETTYERPTSSERVSPIVRDYSSKGRDEPPKDHGDSSSDDDDRGSLLSHDPDDEDAEPEWLNNG